MNLPQISVIMSVHNGEKFLAESIESILNQTLRDLEFIIIDDASTDGTAQILGLYAARDQRIRLLKNDKNIGLTESLNRGISAAQGKYLARQDADDISRPERLERQYVFLEEHPDIFLCGTNCDYLDDQGEMIGNSNNLPTDPTSVGKTLPAKNCFVHTSIMFRNSEAKYREKFYYAQDYDLYLNCLSAGKKMANLEDKLVYWRISNQSVSFAFKNRQAKFAELARKFYRQRIAKEVDDYSLLGTEEILKTDPQSSSEFLVAEELIKICLRIGEANRAKEIYEREYSKSNVPQIRKAIWNMIICFPYLYRAYRIMIRKI